MTFCSQFGEDKWIYDSVDLPSKGFYVDVGCAHPTAGSNTAWLRELGWTGLNIDGDPYWVASWKEAGLPFINSVVSSRKYSRFVYNESEHMLSRTDRSSGEIVRSVPLSYILSGAGVDRIDLLSLDVEGDEFEVWESFDWVNTQPKVVVFEYVTLGKHDWRLADLLDESDLYVRGLQTDANFVYVHRSISIKQRTK